jgi:hypothetical protein
MSDTRRAPREDRVLLITDPRDRRLRARLDRRRTRLLARLLAPTLDRQLAEGQAPESNALLATRAQILVAPESRRALADGWRDVLVLAHEPRVPGDPRVPVNRASVIACETALRTMVDALSVTLPVPARGAAMASWLLSDGAGPVYDRRRSDELDQAVAETIALLDPWVALAPTP